MQLTKDLESNNLKAAHNHLERAKEIVKKYKFEDPRRLIVCLEDARLDLINEQPPTAMLKVEEVIMICDPNKKAYKNIYARALLNRAEIAWQSRYMESAEQYFHAALDYREKHFPKDNRAKAIALARYSDFLFEIKRDAEAWEYSERANRLLGRD